MFYKALIAITMMAINTISHAVTSDDAEALVKKYVESIACSLDEDKMHGFRMTNLDSEEVFAFEDYFAVTWTADLGCIGVSNSYQSFISVVAINSFETPVVMPENDLWLEGHVNLTSVEQLKDGNLKIESKVFAENDPECCPSASNNALLLFDDGVFTFKSLP